MKRYALLMCTVLTGIAVGYGATTAGAKDYFVKNGANKGEQAEESTSKAINKPLAGSGGYYNKSDVGGLLSFNGQKLSSMQKAQQDTNEPSVWANMDKWSRESKRLETQDVAAFQKKLSAEVNKANAESKAESKEIEKKYKEEQKKEASEGDEGSSESNKKKDKVKKDKTASSSKTSGGEEDGKKKKGKTVIKRDRDSEYGKPKRSFALPY